ncbi:Lrp/AsnC family transcriptional regulator [Burkholderia sp. Bp9143]|nr:Lrp/AsnC family transcriptional regulator [Burkholderia sp. Bp9143]
MNRCVTIGSVVMKDDEGTVALNQTDLRILRRLQLDGRATNQELADTIGLSASACLNRIRRLERSQIISCYQAHIALSKVCRHVDVIAAVTLKNHALEDFHVFEEMVLSMRFVVECTKVSGPIDYLVHFVCPDISAYQMLSDELLKIGPQVSNLSSYIVLKSIKPFRGVALEDLVNTEA